jgi:transcriptional regulator with XRE-family HTH domain
VACNPSQLGNLIRRQRKKATLNPKALGERAGLRQEIISLLENGKPTATSPLIPSSKATSNFLLPNTNSTYPPRKNFVPKSPSKKNSSPFNFQLIMRRPKHD